MSCKYSKHDIVIFFNPEEHSKSLSINIPIKVYNKFVFDYINKPAIVYGCYNGSKPNYEIEFLNSDIHLRVFEYEIKLKEK